MDEEKKTYKNILLATSIFGSVQVITLISSFVKHKLLSILIGVGGYGIYGILNSTVDLIKSITGFSIENSAVKAIASEKNTKRNNANIVIKLCLLTAFLGCFITILFSSFISEYIYSTNKKWYLIAFLGVAVFLKQITGAFTAILQGKSKLRQLANSNLISNVLSLIIIIPFFYFFKKNFIVPAIIITAFVNVIIYWIYVKKNISFDIKISYKEAIRNGKEIIFFGGLLMMMSFLPLLVNYAMQVIINYEDGINMLGLYNVSILILNTYVGFLFSAMATEYYPRLVTLDYSNEKLSETVRQQAILTVLLIVPVILVFIAFGEQIIILLFSKDFTSAYSLLKWAVVGMFFKSISFSIGYLFIAKADSKVFMKTSLGFNVLYFLMLYFGYKMDQLNGIGVAIMIYFLLHLIGVYIIAKMRYKMFFFTTKDILIFILLFSFIIAALCFIMFNENFRLILLIPLLIINFVYTIYKINRLVSLKDLFKKR
ncbi:oligosaccharide flippase family protein [Flavobacterium jejuense]|uniref:Oligosaccharide flippase family protein n=1 Tax=Flavobacterium jejuense TaxID=1544455 RepID=A0ABX0IVH8_9FLAO|nr:oligosaccharide flippase family protein [Flavobacterium jejuense]NHN27576.1 oligosaccharide flippase family protein [Flavobacterium jejuense]